MQTIRIKKTLQTQLASWIRKPIALPIGQIQIVWLGQAGFLIRTPEIIIGIDLYLSDSLAEKYKGTEFPHIRIVPSPLPPQNLNHIDILLASHDHTDHMDRGTISEIYKDSDHHTPLMICPRAEVKKAYDCGAPAQRIIGMNTEETFVLSSFKKTVHQQCSIQAIPAAHEKIEVNQYGNICALGYIIDINGLRIYHSGDSIPYKGLLERLTSERIDIALLPVNGRDEYRTSRGVLGNFTIEEASTLAHAANIPFLIPHHYGMFDFNTISIGELAGSLTQLGWTIGRNTLITEIGLVYTIGVEEH